MAFVYNWQWTSWLLCYVWPNNWLQANTTKTRRRLAKSYLDQRLNKVHHISHQWHVTATVIRRIAAGLVLVVPLEDPAPSSSEQESGTRRHLWFLIGPATAASAEPQEDLACVVHLFVFHSLDSSRKVLLATAQWVGIIHWLDITKKEQGNNNGQGKVVRSKK
jgi:hypothetical protein